MDFLTGGLGGLVSGAGSLIGGLIQNKSNQTSQMYANQANYWMQLQNQAWQTQMANTAYQRASADMKAAGLNPAMMYGGSGGAAATPSGGVARAEADKKSDAISPGIDKLLMALRVNNETSLNDAVVNKNVQDAKTSAKQAENIEADTTLKKISTIYAAPEAAARIIATRNTAARTDAERRNTEAAIPGTIAGSDKKKDEAIDYHNFGGSALGGNAASAVRMGGTIGSLASAGMEGFINQNSAKALMSLNSYLFGEDYRPPFKGRLAPIN